MKTIKSINKSIVDRISNLSPDQKKLLEKKLLAKRNISKKTSLINFNKDRTTAPLSFAQQRLWTSEQLNPAQLIYNNPFAFILEGALNKNALEKAVNLIIQRHDILRTIVKTSTGKDPIQLIKPYKYVNLQTITMRGKEDNLKRIREIIDQQITSDLYKSDLFHVLLIELNSSEHILLIITHHLIFDGWSKEIFLEELITSYNAFNRDLKPVLAELPIQYGDFADWQQRSLSDKIWEDQKLYWIKKLQNNTQLNFPLDYQPPYTETVSGQRYSFLLSKELTKKLKQLCQKEEITTFMLLLAAFNILIFRYTGQHDIPIGTLIAGRNKKESEKLIGCFYNNIVMKIPLKHDFTFEEYLTIIRKETLEAYTAQDYPFEKLIEEISPQREINKHPLFDIMIHQRNFFRSNLKMDDIEINTFPIETGISIFDLSLEINDKADEINAAFDFKTELFEIDTIKRISQHFIRLLESIVKKPAAKVFSLPLLSDKEFSQMVHEWNETKTAFPDLSIHQLFEQEAEKQANEIAVVYYDRKISYGELNFRSNILAKILKKNGLSHGDRIGLFFNRSIDIITGILGVLKAGATYVPLDPNLPEERLGFMINDSAIKIIITQKTHFKTITDKQIIKIDIESAIGNLCKLDNFTSPPIAITNTKPDDTAYVMYTSGTKGKPKAVLITHRNVVGLIHSFKEIIGVKERRISTSIGRFSFDLSVEEFFSPLCFGGTVHILNPEESTDAEFFVDYLVENKINTSFIMPEMLVEVFNILKKHPERSSLKCILTGISTIKQNIFQQFRDVFPDLRLINVYGPTETTYGAIAYNFLTADDPEKNIPIGKPFPNYEVYILDSNLQVVPIGVTGEIVIGGIGISKGYLNQPELTKEKFIPHPFKPGSKSFVYRTGDLAKYLPNGNIVFLGRIDDQVKIRGFRIEPGEIEKILKSHPDVLKAFVIVREDNSGDKRLAAYILAKKTIYINTIDLALYLKDKLPEYMLPSALIILNKFPKMKNGKIDRQSLPVPNYSSGMISKDFQKPQSNTEKTIVEIWEKTLNLKNISINDNFFSIGGHSLLAVKAISIINSKYSIKMPPFIVFQSPTIKSLAYKVDDLLLHTKTKTNKIPLASRKSKLSLSFAQERIWILSQFNTNSVVYNIPLAWEMKGILNIAVLEKSLKTIVQRHQTLRSGFKSIEGKPAVFFPNQVKLNMRQEDLSTLEENIKNKEIAELIEKEANTPFSFLSPPLFRVLLIKKDYDSHILQITIHHIVFDGWSVEILLRELKTYYDHYSKNKLLDLSALPIQYSDFSEWQRNSITANETECHLNYWKKKLKSIPPLLTFPPDRTRPSEFNFKGNNYSFDIPTVIKDKLKKFSKEKRTSSFIILLTVFKILINRYTGNSDILIGTPATNRDQTELQLLVGLFVNTLVIRTSLDENSSLIELMNTVKKNFLDASTHQAIQFEHLVEKLNLERNLSQTPVFQIMFANQTIENQLNEFDNISIKSIDIHTNTTKCDLSLFIDETPKDINARISYSTDLYDKTTIERIASHYIVLLEEVLKQPELKIASLSILSEEEQNQILYSWNKTKRGYPDNSIHELFESRVRETPSKIVLIQKDEELTYSQLNNRANLLANFLLEQGAKKNIPIAICMDRSFDFVCTILAILKAGACYLPLDPSDPLERLEFILSDSKPLMVILDRSNHEKETLFKEKIKTLNLNSIEFISSSKLNTNRKSNPEDLAYIMYTSGTTGKPKGVAIRHKSVISLLFGIDYVNLHKKPAIMQLAAQTFDALTFELWAPLLHGGCSVLYPAKEISIREIGNQIIDHKVSILWLTSSLFNAIIDEAPGTLSNISQLLVGGEALSISHIRKALSLLPETQIINGYGPTECTTFSCTYPIPRSLPPMSSVPIGKPISNTRVYILDSNLKPVPIGVIGELYIGGDGLAQGYWNRPELSKKKFIKDPFDDSKEANLFKSGDLARYHPDGNIEILGRIDRQVKINGFRVEIEEIENTIKNYPTVEDTHIVIKNDNELQNRKELIAYVKIKESKSFDVNNLKEFLQKKLPGYMIPEKIINLENFPITSSGKVDENYLLKNEINTDNEKEHKDQSLNPIQKELVKIWKKLLKIKSIGIKDDFFQSGGYSLLATRMIFQIEKEFNVQLPPSSLFITSTIKGLSDLIILEQKNKNEYRDTLIPVNTRGSNPPLFLMHHEEGGILDYRELSYLLNKEQPVYGIQAKRENGKIIGYSDISRAARYYKNVIVEFFPKGPYLIMGHSFGGIIALETGRILINEGYHVQFLGIIDSRAPGTKMLAKKYIFIFLLRMYLIKFFFHLKRLFQMKGKYKFQYFILKVKAVFKRIKKYFKKKKQKISSKKNTPSNKDNYFNITKLMKESEFVEKGYQGKITLFKASLPLPIVEQEDYGWSKYAKGGVEIHVVRGEHGNIMKEPYAKELAEKINRCLDHE